MRRPLSPILRLLAAGAFGVLLIVIVTRRAWREEAPASRPASHPPHVTEPRAPAPPGRPRPDARAPAAKTPAPPTRMLRAPGEPARAAIIMDDLGNSLEPLQELCALGAKVTASILPFAAETRPSAEAAKACGLEVMLHLPLESLTPPARTPTGTISSGMSGEEVRADILACIEQVPGCRGVNNHAGSKATEDTVLMPEILGVLRSKGLYFIDSRTTSATVAYETARALGVPAAERNVFLDVVLEDGAIKSRIEELFRIARDAGRAVGICHPKPETLAALRKYLGLAPAYGVTLVFASEIVD